MGRFLSADPTVQFPDSSQGYNRYTYVNNNPLSLSDPTGYFSFRAFYMTGGDALAGYNPNEYGKAVGTVGPIVGAFLNTIPACEGWCDMIVTAASQAEAGYLETGSIGEGIKDGVLTGAEAEIFTTIGGDFGASPGTGALIERSLAEGLVGGAFATAGGGDFGDGFLGAFASSMAGPYLSQNPRGPGQMIVAALIGGTASRLNGGNFATGALQAALQNLFNEQGPGHEKNKSDSLIDANGCITAGGGTAICLGPMGLEEGADTAAAKFFEGAKYSPEVKLHMQEVEDLFHSFPLLVDKAAAEAGTVTEEIGADGKLYYHLKIEGTITRVSNGVVKIYDGFYHFIKDESNVITHRMFEQDP